MVEPSIYKSNIEEFDHSDRLFLIDTIILVKLEICPYVFSVFNPIMCRLSYVDPQHGNVFS